MKACSFFVGPAHHFEGSTGSDCAIVQGAHQLEAREYAENAVVFPARHLGIQMAADEHRGKRFVLARAARKNVAEAIDTDGAARLAAPVDELVAHFPIRIGEGQTAKTLGASGTNFSGSLEGRP